MNLPDDAPDHAGDPTVDDGTTAASTSPAAVRSDEGPGISDTDDAETRKKATQAGDEAFRTGGSGHDA